MLLSKGGSAYQILQEHLAVISLFKSRGDPGPCSFFLPSDSSGHISLWADLTVSFADLLSGLKLYLICWFRYCKD